MVSYYPHMETKEWNISGQCCEVTRMLSTVLQNATREAALHMDRNQIYREVMSPRCRTKG